MSSEAGHAPVPAIVVDGVAKCYQIYARPQDRLRQATLPRLRRLLGLAPAHYFREFWALREVGFRIERGETVAIIGKNGSGKSTLLQVICGTLTPTAGQVRVDGRVAALLELGSGFNPEFTGRENVYLNGSVLGLTRRQVDERFAAIEAFADIGDFIDQPVKTYSSGMYVRLAFAVIANVDADVLVVDEALAVGDVFFAQKCMRFLRTFQEAGGTLVFVSHSSAAVVNLCRRAIWLEQGRVVMDGPAKDVSEAYHAKSYGLAVAAGAADAAASQEAGEAEAEITDASTMRVFRFNPQAAAFGDGRARITSVRLAGPDGRPLARVEGGEQVRLQVDAEVRSDLDSPVIGFLFKDRLGQHLFGTNTYLQGAGPRPPVRAGQVLRAEFAFRMPWLPVGKYSFDVALADGTHAEHVQNDWVFDGLVIESISSTVSAGLVGLPYHSVTLVSGDADGSDARST
ncbi:MAG TPA: ABC transporter ATP-binding protein [Arenimonas sp.]|uniref:ABC transporter ATP-binding protein n=1 Tax=Arenimonas sp. TaxID=1872635 RepID=UPI002D8101CD|nr:ABC transporter ATP-binding protein [Arenimonas sp.]HEU0151715.1 ABC transporter ATP-binding protein [Arenimonas sp.]